MNYKTSFITILFFLFSFVTTTLSQNYGELRRILMHNPSGMRIEFNIDKQELEIWVSPKAGESLSYIDRNFSNRDDHTKLFDKIYFVDLHGSDYLRTEYDPFYSKIYYKNQTVHLYTDFNYPIVLIKFERQQTIDFKSEKDDELISAGENNFAIKNYDRGYDFIYEAKVENDCGKFIHQLQYDFGRSMYASVKLKENSSLLIYGDLYKNYNVQIADSLLKIPLDELVKSNNKKLDELIKFGKITSKNYPQLDNQLQFNKKIYSSMIDHSGALRAAINKIYYLIWVRDGGFNSYLSYAGWKYPLDKWVPFQFANPTEIYDEEPSGRFFGQLVNKKITKWEEDGLFYAMWSLFTYHTQNYNYLKIDEDRLKLLKDATDWLERYCYDDSLALFGRYHYTETPLKNSRGDRRDNAVGFYRESWKAGKYKEYEIVKSFDIYINMLSYNTYLMLANMENDKAKYDEYLSKALKLEKRMEEEFIDNKYEIPLYGLLKTEEGKILKAEYPGMDRKDYFWALALGPYFPFEYDIYKYQNNLVDTLLNEQDKYFLAESYSLLTSLDYEFSDYNKSLEHVKYTTKLSEKEGKYLPMANSIVENTYFVEGNIYSDIRPQPFSISAKIAAVTNLGIRRLPFGLTIRKNNFLSKIEDFQYQGKLIDFYFNGDKEIKSIIINNSELENSLQIPLQLLKNEKNTVMIDLSNNEISKMPILISSTLQLEEITSDAKLIKYKTVCYGINEMIFKNVKGKTIKILNENNHEIKYEVKPLSDKHLKLRFQGKGSFMIELEK